MRKLRVALVILLILAFITLSQTGIASSIVSPNGMGNGNGLSMSNSVAQLSQIKNKLMSGTSDIGNQNLVLSNYAKYMAAKNFQNATNKTKSTIQPTMTSGFSVPTSGIGDAIKTLGSTQVSFESPAAALKSMKMPTLSVIK